MDGGENSRVSRVKSDVWKLFEKLSCATKAKYQICSKELSYHSGTVKVWRLCKWISEEVKPTFIVALLTACKPVRKLEVGKSGFGWGWLAVWSKYMWSGLWQVSDICVGLTLQCSIQEWKSVTKWCVGIQLYMQISTPECDWVVILHFSDTIHTRVMWQLLLDLCVYGMYMYSKQSLRPLLDQTQISLHDSKTRSLCPHAPDHKAVLIW